VHKRGYRFIAELSVAAGRRVLIYTEEVEDASVTLEEEEREPMRNVQNFASPQLTIASPQAISTRFLPTGNTGQKWTALLIFTTLGATLAVSAYFFIPRYFVSNNRAGGPTPGGAGTIRSIAVLPFTNTSGNPDVETSPTASVRASSTASHNCPA